MKRLVLVEDDIESMNGRKVNEQKEPENGSSLYVT